MSGDARIARRNQPVVPIPDWHGQAACAGMLAFDRQTDADQKAVCRTCPVSAACLDWALEMELWEDFKPQGVYGGVSAKDRWRTRRQFRAALRSQVV